tara:strand:+ start:623 stop:1237 length:615 start_codon:yes stop_codon:yes gene_type:complete
MFNYVILIISSLLLSCADIIYDDPENSENEIQEITLAGSWIFSDYCTFHNGNIFRDCNPSEFLPITYSYVNWYGNPDIGIMSVFHGDTIFVNSDSIGQAFGLNILFGSFLEGRDGVFRVYRPQHVMYDALGINSWINPGYTLLNGFYDLNSKDKTLVLNYWQDSKCIKTEIFSEYEVSMDSTECISEGNTWYPRYISNFTYSKE